METQKIKIGIVILNWNGKNLLKKFLPSVVSNSSDAEIIIIDTAGRLHTNKNLMLELQKMKRTISEKFVNYSFQKNF